MAEIKSGINNTFVLLSLGANLGNREESISEAVKYLSDSSVLTDVKISSIYTSEPVGFADQPEFLNAVVSGYTQLPLNNLIEFCKSAEYYMGRIRRPRWHEREIDIDVLLYGNSHSDTPSVSVPHPRMHERRFVLVPAAEIAGSAVHPSLHRTVDQLLEDCPDHSRVEICEC